MDLREPEKYTKDHDFTLNLIMNGAAAFWEGIDSESDSFVTQGLSISKNAVYYQMKDDLGQLEFRYWLATHRYDYQKMIGFYQSPAKNKVVKEATKVLMPSIEVNQKLWVPMLAKVLDIEEAATYDNLSDQMVKKFREKPEVMHKLQKKLRYRVYHTNMDHYQPTRDVQMRLLSPFPLQVDFETKTVNQRAPQVNKCIVHFHGGGFVAMDSASHQSYTRQWANKLKVPIFSVDYRLAPAYPFPAGINDCFQAYVWIVTQSEE